MPINSTLTNLVMPAGRFQNIGGSISGTWRVWAYDWNGETRGGMVGSANNLPNIYNCTYGSPLTCTSGAAIPPAGNHFIYAAQPSTTVTVNDVKRFVGMNNPTPTYRIDNLIFPDDRSSFNITSLSIPATASSPVGDYPIQMTIASAAGYTITNVYPGTLHVIPEPIITRPPTPEPEPVLTYAFMPFCLNTEEFDSTFKAMQDGDALAHEWARIRTRPRISNCLGVDDRRKGCADF
jgi:hypothetical protein